MLHQKQARPMVRSSAINGAGFGGLELPLKLDGYHKVSLDFRENPRCIPPFQLRREIMRSSRHFNLDRVALHMHLTIAMGSMTSPHSSFIVFYSKTTSETSRAPEVWQSNR